MAELLMKTPIQEEPLRANRWILNIGNVPPYLFRNVNLESFLEKKDRKKNQIYTKLTFSIYNTVNHVVVPDDVILLKKIKLDFLDPTGVVINGYDMNVEFERMSLKCDYSDNGLLTHEFVFWVKNMEQFHSNVNEKSEKEILDNYKKKKES
jgi:hypothetical protein